jgi:drug/metabolite transporter (DMT)-like permease
MYFLLAAGMHFLKKEKAFFWPKGRQVWRGLSVMALGTFFITPILQTRGLHASGAVDNALIIAAEPLVVVALAWIFLKEKLDRSSAVGLVFALVGILLLTLGGGVEEASQRETRWFGNLALFLSIIGEAGCSIAGRDLMKRRLPALGVFGISLTGGVIALTAYALIMGEWGGLVDVSSQFTSQTWLSILWLGPLSTAIGYWFWIHVLNSINPAVVALSLYIQPVSGSLLGLLLLHEPFSGVQALGAVSILVGTLFPLFRPQQ